MRRRSRLASAACRSALVPSWSSAWLTVSTIASACVVLMPAAVRRLIAAWVSRAVAMFASYHFVVPRPVPGSVRQNAHSVSRPGFFGRDERCLARRPALCEKIYADADTTPGHPARPAVPLACAAMASRAAAWQRPFGSSRVCARYGATFDKHRRDFAEARIRCLVQRRCPGVTADVGVGTGGEKCLHGRGEAAARRPVQRRPVADLSASR